MREGKIVTTCSPVLPCNFSTIKQNHHYPGTITFDTGAGRSYVHADVLVDCDYQISGPRTRNYYGAGGDELQLLPYVVNMKVSVEGLGLVQFKDVLVAKPDQPKSGTMLVGLLDMKRLGMMIDFATDTMHVNLGGHKGRVAIPMLRYDSNRQATILTIYEEKEVRLEDIEGILDLHKPDDDERSVVANLGEPCIPDRVECEGCDNCTDAELKLELAKKFQCPTNDPDLKCDPNTAYMRLLERIRQRDRNTYTNGDITIDPEGAAEHPVAAEGIRKLVNDEKYKQIFAKDIGCVGESFAIGGTMSGNLSKTRVGATQFKGETKDAVIKQCLRLIAHKVMLPCSELGIEPKNIMRMMAVQKKDDDGNVVAPLNGLRLVLAANDTNAHTNYAGLQTDNIDECLDFAAKMTRSGLNFKGDLSDCYHLFPLKRELFPYFCLQVPDHEVHAYVRCVQGWNKSAQVVQEGLAVIFWPISQYLRKYMDDVIVATEGTDEDFLVVLKKFFDICVRFNLRMKGSKCVFLAKSTNYLGCEVKNGTVGPNPHRVMKLQMVEAKLLTTKGKLKSFVGMVSFVQKFMRRSAEVLGPLRKIMSGNPSDPIEVNQEFIAEVDKVKRALNEMVATHPFDPDLPTVVVVDTSLKQTGGFIYQMDGKTPKFIAFYSRNRVDAERKIFIGSCHIEILGFGGLLQAFFSMFQSAKLPITLITDSASFVKLFAKFKRNDIPSTDTAINNVFYYMGIILNFNVIHMKNTEAKMMFSDGLSRITEILGLPIPQNDCAGAPQCKVCIAANMIDHGTRIATVMDRLSNSTLGLVREAGLEDQICLPRDLQIFALRGNPPIRKIHFSRIKNTKYTLESLLNDKEVLEVLQSKSSDLRKLRKALEEEVVNFPKHEARLQRMMDDEKAELVDGVIYITKDVEGQPRPVIPLPLQSAPIAIAATHETVGHRSLSQLVLQVKVNFHFPNIKDMVAAFVDNCVRCSLQKGGGNYVKKKMKPVPLPEDMFTTIIMDEMVRTFKKETVRFLVAMEGISQFVTCIVYEGAMTGPKFLAMVASCKAILCPHGMKSARIELRVDAAPWHTSAVVRECLAQLNVELQVHQSTTFSKNILPELDNKMRRLGEHIASRMEESPVPLQLAVHLAAAKCNSTIGSSGKSPAEIFTGRGWRNNEMIQIDVRQLLEQIVKRRESHRVAKERERAAKHMKKELELIPYEDESLNSPFVTNRSLVKIRVGDWVTLKLQPQDDKNDIPSAWVVLDISFPRRTLHLKRTSGAESGHGESRWVAFELVEKVFPKTDRIRHIQSSSELEEFEEDEADRIWIKGRQDVSKLVLSALVATHELWAGPEDCGEELVPNLNFNKGNNEPHKIEETKPMPKMSCDLEELPKQVKITPEQKKEDWKEEFVDFEEFLTPEGEMSPTFKTPKAASCYSKKEGKAKVKSEKKVKIEKKSPPPKLDLDREIEDEKLPPAPFRRSSRIRKPIKRYQAGQK